MSESCSGYLLSEWMAAYQHRCTVQNAQNLYVCVFEQIEKNKSTVS